MSRAVAGIDVGGTKMLGVVIDPASPEVVLAELRTPTATGADGIVEAAVGLVRQLAAGRQLTAVGLGIAGLVDRKGTLRVGPNLPGIVDAPFAERLADRLGLPIVVDNDATAATWAEARVGAGRHARDMVFVALGTGIGGGLVQGGIIQRGAHGFGGEFGHMVVDPRGPRCPCGGQGCWERFASGTGLGRLAREDAQAGRLDSAVALAGGDPEDVRGEHVVAAARQGDEAAVAVLGEFAWWVGLGVANLITALDPEVVVLGGGVVESIDLLLEPIRRSVSELVLASAHRPEVPILPAELGERAGAVGAALLAADALAT